MAWRIARNDERGGGNMRAIISVKPSARRGRRRRAFAMSVMREASAPPRRLRAYRILGRLERNRRGGD